jgi:hypothetical protein
MPRTPLARECAVTAQKARLDGLPNTAAILDRAAQTLDAQAHEIARLRAALRRLTPRAC